MRMNKMQALRVLLIEHDVALSKTLCEYLESQGYVVHLAHSGYQADRLMRRRSHDVALLDADLQDVPAIEWLRCYRRQTNTPLILLTGARMDCVDGLDSGADDCLARPLHLSELKARMHALLRRHGTDDPWAGCPSRSSVQSVGSYRGGAYRSISYRGSEADGLASPAVVRPAAVPLLVAGPLSLNPATGATTLHGSDIALTGTEQRILEILMRSAGSVVQRHNIGAYALGRIPTPYDRSIDTHISSLRRKLGAQSQPAALMIRNLRGQGYVLAASDNDTSVAAG
ncbi:chemotaxis protein CheY [Advenella kashmirensis W13003]|uniref:Chemotaxis protein CheY n=2 Tax=Advenella kashmirensis TaxID=310575 RepID=V8QYM8_9BURK|nr:chemotaxis protein CheY [Advenella kashmirensis W13003]